MEQESSEDLYQISLLIDQLKHDDATLRANAYKELQRIGRPPPHSTYMMYA